MISVLFLHKLSLLLIHVSFIRSILIGVVKADLNLHTALPTRDLGKQQTNRSCDFPKMVATTCFELDAITVGWLQTCFIPRNSYACPNVVLCVCVSSHTYYTWLTNILYYHHPPPPPPHTHTHRPPPLSSYNCFRIQNRVQFTKKVKFLGLSTFYCATTRVC